MPAASSKTHPFRDDDFRCPSAEARSLYFSASAKILFASVAWLGRCERRELVLLFCMASCPNCWTKAPNPGVCSSLSCFLPLPPLILRRASPNFLCLKPGPWHSGRSREKKSLEHPTYFVICYDDQLAGGGGAGGGVRNRWATYFWI